MGEGRAGSSGVIMVIINIVHVAVLKDLESVLFSF